MAEKTNGARKAISIAVQVTGEILLTLGVLLLLFVGWQIWWTDVVANKEHQEILTQLNDEWGVTTSQIAPAETGDPPIVEQPAEKTIWGQVHIPKFDKVTSPLAEGVSLEEVLNVIGNGHYPETVMPGEVGNFSFAGHRTTYGRPLHDIARLEPGDPVIIQTKEAYYVYTVTESQIVLPHQVEVIAEVPNHPEAVATERMLTMTACHPLYSARERYIVHAKFSHWVDPAKGIPEELNGVL